MPNLMSFSSLLNTDPRRIVLLGKTGSGKSSLANTVFGDQDTFKVNHKSVSGAKTCESKTKTIGSRIVQLIDTPGFLDTDPTSTEQSPEILRCITECAPGPHAFLIVMKVERYTKQKCDVDKMLSYFSENALKYTTVVFTHGDQLPEGEKIEDWISDNEALSNLVQKCGGRCHVFDNEYWNNSQDQYRNNQIQVKKLLETIDNTEKMQVAYICEMLQNIHDEIDVACLKLQSISDQLQTHEFSKMCDYEMYCEAPPDDITLNDLYQAAKQVVYHLLLNNMGGALAGVLVGALLGAGATVVISAKFSPSLFQCVALGVTGAAVAGLVGGLLGAWASEKWSCPTEAVQDAVTLLREVKPLVLLVNQMYQAGCVLTSVFS